MLTSLLFDFSDTQGQLTPKSVVEFRQSVNKIICRFFRCSRAANSEVSGRILRKFKFIEAFIVVLVTGKNEEDPIKNEVARVLTSLLFVFFRRSRVANSELSSGIPPKF